MRPHVIYDYRELTQPEPNQSSASRGALLHERSKPSVVGIGNFDGVHRGHQRLIEAVIRASGETHDMCRRCANVLTFDPHPTRFFRGVAGPRLIYTLRDRIALLAELGVERVIAQRFDERFASLSPEEFVNEVLIDGLNATHVVVGHDFSFGARRAGNVEQLVALCAQRGVKVEVIRAQQQDERNFSSTWTREALAEGQVELARELLGRPYHVRGVVRAGYQRGRQLGFPTANLELSSELCPSFGVYAGWLDWGDGPQPAVVSVGDNPTFAQEQERSESQEPSQPWSVEAHVLNEPLDSTEPRPWVDLYQRPVTLWFTRRLRSMTRFDGVEALRDQISRDCDSAREALSGDSAPSWPRT